MADEDAVLPFPTSTERHHKCLLEVEGKLRECLNMLDNLGLSLTAAHVDLALHQLYSDLGAMRASDQEAPSSGLEQSL